MKEAFKNLFEHCMISIGALRQAVLDGILTEEDYEEITKEKLVND